MAHWKALPPILLATVLALSTEPVTAQSIDFGKPLWDLSVTADSRSVGIETSFTYVLHGGLSAYQLRETPLSGPDTGLRLDLGFGLGDKWKGFEAFHFSMGGSLVSDPSPRNDHRVRGLGLFAQADLTLGAHILVGVYGLAPMAKGHDFGTVGVKVGVRLPPYG
jgi:hypothetical protein